MGVTEGGPAAQSFSDELAVGARAGPWLIEHELGRGGMGIVYAVVHEGSGKRAALKVLHRSVVGRAAFKPERVLLEARAVNAIGHPNVVDIFETGVLDDGRPYIVMERLLGESLTERAARGIAPGIAIAVLLRVCEALRAAHAAGVVHRDLKPDNIFLVTHPEHPRLRRVKLLDWGIARMLHHDPQATLDGQLVGTPQYLAPEQARGERVSAATDVYSLGVVAYELFLGRLPFEALTATEMMAQHMLAPPLHPRARWVAIPRALEELLLAMLAKDPRQRPPIAAVARHLVEARAELTRQDRAFEVVAFPDPEPARPTAEMPAITSRRWPVTLGVLVLLASGGLFMIAQRGDRRAGAYVRAGDAYVRTAEPAPTRPAIVIPEPRPPAAEVNPTRAACGGPRTRARHPAPACARPVRGPQ